MPLSTASMSSRVKYSFTAPSAPWYGKSPSDVCISGQLAPGGSSGKRGARSACMHCPLPPSSVVSRVEPQSRVSGTPARTRARHTGRSVTSARAAAEAQSQSLSPSDASAAGSRSTTAPAAAPPPPWSGRPRSAWGAGTSDPTALYAHVCVPKRGSYRMYARLRHVRLQLLHAPTTPTHRCNTGVKFVAVARGLCRCAHRRGREHGETRRAPLLQRDQTRVSCCPPARRRRPAGPCVRHLPQPTSTCRAPHSTLRPDEPAQLLHAIIQEVNEALEQRARPRVAQRVRRRAPAAERRSDPRVEPAARARRARTRKQLVRNVVVK
jgi:hypothetical protein